MLALVAALAVAAAAPFARFPGLIVDRGIQTPSGNIVCNAGHLGPRLNSPRGLACVVFSVRDPRGRKTWFMRTDGPAETAFVQADAATDVPVLGYGRTWTWHGIRCSSARQGLTCRNRSGHGFFLSRARQSLF